MKPRREFVTLLGGAAARGRFAARGSGKRHTVIGFFSFGGIAG